MDDSGEARIEKLWAIIKECRYGIHDLSRTELDRQSNLPRFNMPLELGMFLGAKRFGVSAQKKKRILIFDTKPFRYQKFISDLAGMDIHAHQGNIRVVVEETRDWLANVTHRRLPGGQLFWKLYRGFRSELPSIAKHGGLDAHKLPYGDFMHLVVSWLNPAK
jgi:hypothetical protein